MTLDYNTLGRQGCDVIAYIVKTSKNLLSLSMQRCRIESRDIHNLSENLAINKQLRYLNLGSNKIGSGCELLFDSLAKNSCLEVLELFDVDFSNQGAFALTNLLQIGSSYLRNLRLANTHVSADVVELVMDAAQRSPNLRCLRWTNLVPLQHSKHWEQTSLSKLLLVEHRKTPLERGSYLNPYIGDLQRNLLADIYKCQ